MQDFIDENVHSLYWNEDINCARTTLLTLSKLYNLPLDAQVVDAAIGMHGAGGYKAQCGLVEGTLMFIGILFRKDGKTDGEIASLCRSFAERFENEFGSLLCSILRPRGFNADDPPHLCEALSKRAIYFSSRCIAERL